MECPSCGAEVTEIQACHTYMIEYNTVQERWTKSTGEVEYTCADCQDELKSDELDVILKQVDEL